MKYKVWVINYDGRNMRLAASKTKSLALLLFDSSPSNFKDYAWEAVNDQDRELALNNIGTVYSALLHGEFKPVLNISVSPSQVKLMALMTGLDKGKRVTVNNLTLTGEQSEERKDIQDLISKGYAEQYNMDVREYGPVISYRLTEKGLLLAKGLC